MSDFRFRPIRGTDEQIQNIPHTEGAVYFTTDTKKIYCDFDGERKPMGGNSGIFYGTLKHNITDPSVIDFEFTMDDIEGDQIPNVSDLILNSDGCFYKVVDNKSENIDGVLVITTVKLTIAGSGGGGGGTTPGGPEPTISMEVIKGVKGPYIFGQSANIIYKTTAKEDYDVMYTITIKSSGGQQKIIQRSAASGAEWTYDIGSQLFAGLNSVTVAVMGENSGNTQRNYNTVNCIQMLLEESQNFNCLNVVNIVDSTLGGVLNFKCRPIGAQLTKTLSIYVDGILRPELTKTTNASGQDLAVDIPGLSHGVHVIKAVLSTGEDAGKVEATPLEYEIACIDSSIATPVIWLDKYPSQIVDHDKLTIKYKVYNPANPAKAEVHLFMDQEEIPTSPVETTYIVGEEGFGWEEWAITTYHIGNNNFTISCGSTSRELDVKVIEDTLRDLNVLTSGLLVNLDSKGRSNRENQTSRENWVSKAADGTETKVQFENFNWYNNGWINDDKGDSCLRISNGAKIRIPLSVMNTSSLQTGLTFEFQFKLRNVQNLSTLITTTSSEDENGKVTITKTIDIEEGVFGSYFGNDIGLCLGTQEAFFKSSGNSIVNARYTDGQMINLSFVVESSSSTKPLMYIYLNGILSGIANYSTSADNFDAKVQEFVINSDYCDVDLYKMRVYNKAQLSSIEIVHNYIADMVDANLYDMNQITDFVNNIPKINYSKVIEYNINNPDNQTMPYAVIEISQDDEAPNDERLPFVKGGKRKVDVEFVNPWLDRAYELKEISDTQYFTGCPSFSAKGAQFDVQGTSSQGYPRRNYKGKFKDCTEWIYTAGPKEGESLLSSHTIDGKTYDKGYYMDNKDASETTFTWKADYMESSGTHNTGFTSFVKTLYSHHPLEDLLGSSYVTGDHRTTIYGFPMMVFQRYHDGTYEFVGKYNFNLDKACNNVIDFKNGSDHPYVKKADGTQEKIKNVAECWEFKNNQGTRCSFNVIDFEELNEKGDLALLTDLEYRYNHDEDMFDDAIEGKEDKFPTKEGAHAYILNEFRNLKRLFEWLESTDTNKATGETFAEPKVFTSTVGDIVSTQTFEADTKEYRLAKFQYEFTKHFNPEYCYIYFIMTELVLGYDSRGKNMMLASWGPQEEGGEYIWYPVFYDIDTQLGVNNSGVPTWEYNTNATADKQFSTADSVLWNNLWSCFSTAIKNKYIELRKTTLTIQNLNGYYDFDPSVSKSYAMMGCRPLNMINVDEYYKYIAPAFTGYLDTSGDRQETSLYFYCLQGSRELQRELFLRNRFNYIDSEWLGGPYAKEAVQQELKIRYNANDAINTSDKFVSKAPTDTTTDTWKSFLNNGGSVKPYKESPLDANATFQITPYLKQFVGAWFDETALQPKYFDGENPVTIEPLPNTQTSIEETVGFSQQLIYFGGVEYISKFGDLSLKYANEFAMNKAIRLKELYLGNEDAAYDNRLMSDAYFNLAASAYTVDNNGNRIANPYGKPLLETIVLTNIGSISSPQDLTSCEKLKTFRALGTGLGGVTLAPGTIIDTLYLPSTITYFDLTEPISLNAILTEKPQANAAGEFPKGLFIDGVTNLTTVQDDSTTKINRINIAGGNMGYKSFELVDKVVQIKQKMQSNAELPTTFSKDLRINLDKIAWSPYRLVGAGESIITGATYAKKTEHYTFEDYVPGSTWASDTLNGKIYQVDTDKLANEAHLITDLSLLDTFITSYLSQENYFKGTTEHADGKNTIPYISGDLFIANDSSNKISETKLKNTYKDVYFPDLNIFVAHAAESYVAKFIELQDSGQEYEWDILKFDPSEPVKLEGSKVIPTKLHYDFVGWADHPNATPQEVILTSYPIVGENSDGSPIYDTGRKIWSDYKFSDSNTVMTFYAVYDKHKYVVKFINGTEEKQLLIPYGESLREHPDVPYKDDAGLELFETYAFKGYSAEKDSNTVVNLADYKSTKNYTFYAVFAKQSVYDQPTDSKYFIFNDIGGYNDLKDSSFNVSTGCEILLDRTYMLKGKVTIPTHSPTGLPVVRIGDYGFSQDSIDSSEQGHQISHIFFMPDTKVRVFGNRSFQEDNTGVLSYLEIPDSLRRVEANALYNLNLKMDSIHTGKNVYYLGSQSFANCLADDAVLESFTIGSTVTDMSTQSVANFAATSQTAVIYWGGPNDPAQLSNVNTIDAIFSMNNFRSGGRIGSLEIYCTADRESYFNDLIANGFIKTNSNNQFNINIIVTA